MPSDIGTGSAVCSGLQRAAVGDVQTDGFKRIGLVGGLLDVGENDTKISLQLLGDLQCLLLGVGAWYAHCGSESLTG